MDEHEKALKDKEVTLIENKTVINNFQQVFSSCLQGTIGRGYNPPPSLLPQIT